MPNALKIPVQPGGVEGQKLRDKLDSRFNETWISYADDFEQAVGARNLDGAHDIWCLAAETFLCRQKVIDSVCVCVCLGAGGNVVGTGLHLLRGGRSTEVEKLWMDGFLLMHTHTGERDHG